MTDIESELRDAMHAVVDGASYPEDPLDLLRRRRARRKARAATAAGFAVTAVLAATAIAVTLHGGERPVKPSKPAGPTATEGSRPPVSPPPPGWVRHADGTGDYIDAPAAWHAGGGLVQMTSPLLTWVVSTGPVPKGGSCAPTAALRKLPTDGALFAVIEYPAQNEPYTFPPRGRVLSLGPRGGPYECWGVYTDLVLFQDGGRYFQVQTVFGPRARAALRAEVRRSLNTLHIKPLPAADQPPALCRTGQWTYCPQAVWVYQVIGAARVAELGNLGTRAISGLEGNISFGMWTTTGSALPRGDRCYVLAGTKVCGAGQRLWWRVHELVLWVAPASSPYSTPPVGPGLPTRRVLARLIVASKRTPLPAS
jgi:hypothetical protein